VNSTRRGADFRMGRRARAFGVIAALLVLPLSACERKPGYYVVSGNDKLVAAIEISPSLPRKAYRLHMSYRQPKLVDGIPARHMSEERRYDCQNQSTQPLSQVIYNLNGQKIFEEKVNGGWEAAKPGTSNAKALKIVCGWQPERPTTQSYAEVESAYDKSLAGQLAKQP